MSTDFNNEFDSNDTDLESEGFLLKSCGRKGRLDKSEKARKTRDRRKAKMDRMYNDGFGGNADQYSN
jgi:hypothetical protein